MMSTEIEQRLRSLASSAMLRTADERAIADIRSWPRPKPRIHPRHVAIRVSAATAAVLMAILIANVAAVYYAPSYERVLAGSGAGPVSQKLLAAFGLHDGDVTVVNDSATSAGHTVRLVAGYADGLRTVLFLSIDGKGLTGDPKGYGMSPGDYGIDLGGVTLTDQFGRRYGFGTGVAGANELLYEPLLWPASEVGGRLTLHITGLTPLWDRRPAAATVSGDWTLHATLISEPSHSVAIPAPIHASGAVYRFTSITASSTEMVVHWTIDSPLNDPLRTPPQPGQETDPSATAVMQQYFMPRVYAETGTVLRMMEWGFTWPKTGPAEGMMIVYLTGPGRYRIQLGGAVESRWVVVP